MRPQPKRPKTARGLFSRRRRWREGSFTLIEVTIALALMSALIVEVAAVQGSSVVFSDFGRNITQGTYLARRVLAQVQYYYRTKPFTDLETKVEGKFEDFPEYTWALEIKEWKFPFTQILTGGFGGGGEDGDDGGGGDEEEGGLNQIIETAMEQIFGDEPKFMTAFVEVSWADGAQKNSTSMTYLLSNQAKLDEFLATKKATYDKLVKGASAKPCKEFKKKSTCTVEKERCKWNPPRSGKPGRCVKK